jgi:peptide deformylase
MRVVAKGVNRHGKDVRIKGDGLLARAIQHEIDHLDGVLFTSKVTEGTLREVEPDTEAAEAEVVTAV